MCSGIHTNFYILRSIYKVYALSYPWNACNVVNTVINAINNFVLKYILPIQNISSIIITN